MGDSGAEDTSDSYDANMGLSDAEVAAATGDDNNQSRSNISDSSTYDAQFTADNLEARGLEPSNFMSPSNFAQTTQGGGGDDNVAQTLADQSRMQQGQVSVPIIQAADTTPTFSGVGVSDVFDPMTMQSRSDTMVEALGAAPTTTAAAGTPSFDAFGNPVTVQSFLPTSVTVDRTAPQTKQERGLQAVANMFAQGRDRRAGMGDERGIDFGVTAPSIVGDDFGPALDMADRSNMANITETALGARTPGTRTTDQILADQSRMQQGQIPSTTATGTTTGDAQFGVSPGRLQAEFGPRVASLAGGLDAQKTADIADLTNRPGIGTTLGLPSFARGAANFIGQKSRDRMAEAIARGRTDPLFGKGSAITDANLIRNDQGQVVGIRDNQGNLIEGMDPNEQMQQGDDSQQQEAKKKAPKKPDDPCPDGYKLIDGKCTIIEDPNEGTGFIRFPTDRDPPFQTGPFQPKSTPTKTTGIRALNPITMNNPFRPKPFPPPIAIPFGKS